MSESEISGTLYNATAILKRSDVFPGESSTETEIVLDMDMDMEREGETEDNEEGVSGKALALVSEWMFLRAMKWTMKLECLIEPAVYSVTHQTCFISGIFLDKLSNLC